MPEQKGSEPFLKQRYLAWIGITGLALTVTGSLEPLIKLGNIVHFVVENWRSLTGFVWNSLFSIFDVKLSPVSIGFLNGGVFAFAIEAASYSRHPTDRSLWWFPIRLINVGIVFVVSWGIAVSTIWPIEAEVAPLPDPFILSNWTKKETLVPLVGHFS
jgi:hypothetical protein